jgi:hypothetical protein
VQGVIARKCLFFRRIWRSRIEPDWLNHAIEILTVNDPTPMAAVKHQRAPGRGRNLILSPLIVTAQFHFLTNIK